LGNWLGTGAISTHNRKYLDFEAARAHVRALKLSGKDQWGKYSKSGNKPLEIPFHPERAYKKQWKDTMTLESRKRISIINAILSMMYKKFSKLLNVHPTKVMVKNLRGDTMKKMQHFRTMNPLCFRIFLIM
jgi:hypothetical protein